MTVSEILDEAKRICKAGGAQKVILFGSRAKGAALERSDIDIAVSGVSDIEAIREALEEMPTLIRIDLVDLDTCSNPLLLEDIETYGREI